MRRRLGSGGAAATSLGVLLIGVALIFTGSGVQAASGEIVVIANPDVTLDDIAPKFLERIYLGKRTRWDDDRTIVPVMLKAGPTHEEFVETYLERSVHRFVTYWRQLVFTGKGVPPKSFGDEQALVAYVAGTAGAIGYVSEGNVAAGVKILRVR